MTFSSEIIQDFAVITAVAGLVTFIFHRLKLPLILGYLAAGIIIGPYSPPFSLVNRLDFLGALADMGVIMLLFGVGLEFPLERLRRIGLQVYAGISAIEIALMFLISYGVGYLLHWPLADSLFLGAALASSSTVVIGKVLTDMDKLKDTSALVMMGVLVAEDLIVVLILALVTSIVGARSFGPSVLAWDLIKIFLFVFGTLGIGMLVVPRVIDWVANPERDDRFEHKEHGEVLLLVGLAFCFGLSAVAIQLGLSVAIGAFLIGVLMAGAKSAAKVAGLTSGIKDMFGAIFFVSMGALIDITQFSTYLVPALIVTGIMLAGKVIGCGLGTRAFGYDATTSLRVGLGMGQIGEFALIVAKAGEELNAVSSFLFPTIGVAVGITTFLTPYMISLSYRIDVSRWTFRKRRGK